MHEIAAGFHSGGADERTARALRDVRDGVSAYPIWALLGWQDIKQRYRRSVIGPFWITISTAVMVVMLGVLYAGLFNQPLAHYLPFVGVSLVAWALVSTILNEACTVFIVSESMIKQVRAPLTVHVCRMVFRNLLIFGHNAVILLAIYLLFWKPPTWQLALVPLAIAVYALNGVWVGIVLGTLCARFRDIPPIMQNIVQVLFFLTPIMWQPQLLEARGMDWIARLNPLHHFLEILRAPLLGYPFPLASWLTVAACSLAGAMLALATLRRCRHRVAYWL